VDASSASAGASSIRATEIFEFAGIPPLFHKGRELYGLYEARQARRDFKRLMIVEGYMDVVRLHQAGINLCRRDLGYRNHPGTPE